MLALAMRTHVYVCTHKTIGNMRLQIACHIMHGSVDLHVSQAMFTAQIHLFCECAQHIHLYHNARGRVCKLGIKQAAHICGRHVCASLALCIKSWFKPVAFWLGWQGSTMGFSLAGAVAKVVAERCNIMVCYRGQLFLLLVSPWRGACISTRLFAAAGRCLLFVRRCPVFPARRGCPRAPRLEALTRQCVFQDVFQT